MLMLFMGLPCSLAQRDEESSLDTGFGDGRTLSTRMMQFTSIVSLNWNTLNTRIDWLPYLSCSNL